MAGRAPSFFGDAVGKVIKERQELLKVEAQKAQKAEKALEKLRKEFEKVESQLAATKEEVAHLNAELELQEEKHAAELDCSPDALALAVVLAQPFEPHVLSGAVTTDQIASNLGALPVAERLRGDPELLGRIMGETRQDSEAYWAERAALAWN